MSTTEDRAESAVYEIGYLVLPSIPEDSLSDVVSKIDKSIQEAGATRIAGEEPFLYPLAYEMSKTVGARKYVVNEAYFGWVKFEAEPSMIESIKSELDEAEEILRHLLIKAPRESKFTFSEMRRKKAEAEAERQAEAEALIVQAPEKEAEEGAKDPVIE